MIDSRNVKLLLSGQLCEALQLDGYLPCATGRFRFMGCLSLNFSPSNVKVMHSLQRTNFKMHFEDTYLEILITVDKLRTKSSSTSLETMIHGRKHNHHYQNLMFFVIFYLCTCSAFESLDRIKICRTTKKITSSISHLQF